MTLTANEQRVAADFERALVLRDLGSYREGIALLEDVITRLTAEDPRLLSMAHMQIAYMHKQLHDDVSTERHFRIATSISPGSELASLGLFHALLSLSRTEDAMVEMVRLLRLRGSSDYADMMLGDFGPSLPAALAPLADQALRLIKRHAVSGPA